MQSPFLINVEPLLQAPLRLEVDARPEELDLGCEEFEFPGRVKGTLTFVRTGRDVRCTGNLSADARTQCARCLRPVDFPLEAGISLAWLHRDPATSKHEEPHSDRILAEYYSGDTIDAREALRETLMAELPALLRCSEACKGLCPRCGADRNLGPCACEAAPPPPAPGAAPVRPDWKSQLRSLRTDR